MGNTEDKLNKIKQDYNQGKKQTFIGFWGNKHDTLAEASFSNFADAVFKAEITVDLDTNQTKEIEFENSEQYFMYLKALHFKDNDKLKDIVAGGHSPYGYQQIGRRVDNFVENEWNAVNYDYMKQALRLKFSNNPKLKKYLLDTGNAVLVEASPVDRLWGVGLAKKTRDGRPLHDWRNPLKWRGKNLLGLALMDVREELSK